MPCSNEKKKKSVCGTKHPTKGKVKKCRRKMSQWINDAKSACTREDLTYKVIHYTNICVIEADEFRKNLGVKNNQSIRIEREMIYIIMKIFAK